MREELSRYQDLTKCSIEELGLTKEDFKKIEELHFKKAKGLFKDSWKSTRLLEINLFAIQYFLEGDMDSDESFLIRKAICHLNLNGGWLE